MKESEIERHLVQSVEQRGGIAWKWPASAHAGVPDRIVVLDGRVVFVEVKQPGGRLRKIQQVAHRMLRSAGAVVEVVWSYDDVNRLCDTLHSTRTGL